MSQQPKNFDIVFQKLSQITADDAEIVMVTQEVSKEIEASSAVVEELRLLAEVKADTKHEEFYSGT